MKDKFRFKFGNIASSDTADVTLMMDYNPLDFGKMSCRQSLVQSKVYNSHSFIGLYRCFRVSVQKIIFDIKCLFGNHEAVKDMILIHSLIGNILLNCH
ncbi:unnamed protein product (macronuclear) [Paramecium tetraurelia]|uniref:Uncharacterized protein n=1 Tax=Paramecium tetraurelia TaxID=5888 RepID=A0DHK0_PARTE|nr:uncharacterized protein GSPATT00016904001 [Paramecium tetraurelia]CAK82517.1 unnamed protein product [Paramecium tetraurelia]|eukprot:XP_001449914.1 hypothetical protein (macronuclear) [Paramecium tetraurelia strain d4-2]